MLYLGNIFLGRNIIGFTFIVYAKNAFTYTTSFFVLKEKSKYNKNKINRKNLIKNYG